jgi:hypothetical protein
MRFLGLASRGKTLTFLMTLALAGAIAALRPTLAHADGAPTARLALSSDPGAGRHAMVDAPGARMGDAPATTERTSSASPWWVWVAIAAGVAGVAALVLTTQGKDPTCPSDRTCH